MAKHNVRVTLTPTTAITLLTAADRDVPHDFVMKAAVARGDGRVLYLSMREDGDDMPHQIELHENGTWCLTTGIPVGQE